MTPWNRERAREAGERERILAGYFNVTSIKGDNRALAKRYLLGSLYEAVVTPLLFFAKFGVINGFAIAFTVFLVVLTLLFAFGLYFQSKTQYHTEVQMKGNFADRVGAFWLVACAFGPFLGWLITAFSPTAASWRWQYLARVLFAVILPVITAVPLIRYARGKAALIGFSLLIGITALPILSCSWVLADLNRGAKLVRVEVIAGGQDRRLSCQDIDDNGSVPCELIRPVHAGDQLQVTWLPHTQRVLAVGKL